MNQKNVISIPHGTIKSWVSVATALALAVFQYLMVQLKDLVVGKTYTAVLYFNTSWYN